MYLYIKWREEKRRALSSIYHWFICFFLTVCDIFFLSFSHSLNMYHQVGYFVVWKLNYTCNLLKNNIMFKIVCNLNILTKKMTFDLTLSCDYTIIAIHDDNDVWDIVDPLLSPNQQIQNKDFKPTMLWLYFIVLPRYKAVRCQMSAVGSSYPLSHLFYSIPVYSIEFFSFVFFCLLLSFFL